MGTTETIKVVDIKVGERFRQDYGDVEELAESIKEFGLLQPIVIDDDNNLCAGGRRLNAVKVLGWEDVPFFRIGQIPEDRRKEIELEENVRRKDMSWQERAIAIATIHQLKKRNAVLGGDKWGYRETGELLGLAHGPVHRTCQIGQRLLASAEDPMWKCDSMFSATRLQEREAEDEGLKVLAAMTGKPQVTTPPPETKIVDGKQVVVQPPPQTNIKISQLVVHDDCIKWFYSDAYEELFDHIITDAPYAIDTDMMQQDNQQLMDVSRIEAEHDVDENIDLLKKFIPMAAKALRPTGFLIMWCDITHWTWLSKLATDNGFRVTRWPLIWHKTHVCKNQAAQFNPTKNFEVALVAARPKALIPRPMMSSVFACPKDEGTKDHPFAKPALLWTWLIESFTLSNQLILEPFAGIGSMTLAALAAGRRVISVEKNDKHYNHLLENVKGYYIKAFGSNTTFS